MPLIIIFTLFFPLLAESPERMYLKYAIEILDCIPNPQLDTPEKEYFVGCPRIAIIHVPDDIGLYRIMEVTIIRDKMVIVRFIEIKSKYGEKLNVGKLHKQMKKIVFDGDDYIKFKVPSIDFCMPLPSGIGSDMDYWVAAEASGGGTIAIRTGVRIGSHEKLVPWIESIEKMVFKQPIQEKPAGLE